MFSDKITINTPEQVSLEFQAAGVGSRFIAVLIDYLIQFAIILLLLIVLFAGFFASSRFTGTHNSSVWIVAIYVLASFCIQWGYFSLFEILWKGQTPGKRVAGVRVIKNTGRSVNVSEALMRNLLRFVDWLPGLYAIGVITMLLNSQNRRLGDLVAGTLVVHEKSLKRQGSLFQGPQGQADPTMFQAAALGIPEAELIETFLTRRWELSPEVRSANGARIAGMISSRLGIAPHSRTPNNEEFLETVIMEFRNRARHR
ncbi:MAG TPA: RDD family protein [Candidatus Angelobacter sp.]|nr:RDD family protein [Candidatus Angelobacter sp.]